MTELTCDELRHTVDPTEFEFETTADVKPLDSIVGQDRAVRSLRFGLAIDDEGYNVFVSGVPGTGKNTAIRAFIEAYAKELPTPPDWCYVYNFRDSYRPTAISLPAGRARVFSNDMDSFVEAARRQIADAFESDEYTDRRSELRSRLEEERHRTISEVEKEAQDAGFALRNTQMGLFFVPIKNGKPLGDEEIASLDPDERDRLRRTRQQLDEKLRDAMKSVRKAEQDAYQEVVKLNEEAARFAVGGLLEDLREKYADIPAVIDYLRQVEDDIVENVDSFQQGDGDEHSGTNSDRSPQSAGRKYKVNVIVDNGEREGAPVIFEVNPSYTHLFGRIEKEAHMGALYTDFTLIKSGSLHSAAGGFLVLKVEDLLRNPLSWEALKRSLREGEIEMEEPLERMGMPTTKSLRPLPISLKVKVILTGTPELYQLLHSYDAEFSELFKVKAEFDTSMRRAGDGIRAYVELVGMLCRQEGLCNLDPSAVARIIEHGSRLAEHREKLSTKFSSVADVLREATYWARQDNSSVVKGPHVTTALKERHYRLNLIEEKIQELMRDGTIMVGTEGEAIGQVNGLSVLSLGDLTFGRPSRITCTTSLGQEGIVDIEREVKLGGPIHSKGIMILSGFLSERFAQDYPLALSARLVFEQSYSGVDGDSASCAELCALLSRISGCPIRQSFAMTGSVNQKGELQPIGGVNEKIEGFFDVCRVHELTGDQGVIIPAANRQNLMLREDVVDAVRDGKFHVYAVSTVTEALELLTGMEAGEQDADGKYPKDSLMGRAHARLREMAERLRRYGNGQGQGA